MMKPILSRLLPLRSMGILACVQALALLQPRPASAAVFVVTNGVADSSKGSLTYMLHRVSEGDTITFNVAEQDTLRLGAEIALSKGLSVFGSNKATGNRICLIGSPRVFKLTAGAFKLTHLLMRGKYAGSAREFDGAVIRISGPKTSVLLDSVDVRWGLAYARGGGILNDTSTLVIANSRIMDNDFESSTYGYGGGIYNRAGKIRMTNTTLAKNGGQYGGGLYNDANGNVEMDKCVVSDQSLFIGGLGPGYTSGGGIYNEGRMSITNSTISDNIAEANLTSIINNAYASGGGIYNKGTLTLANCTVTGNSCPASTRNSDAFPRSQGGGIFNDDDGLLYITNSTIAFNTKTGGIEGYNVFALNTIIACNKGYNARNAVKGRNNLDDSLPAKVFGDAKAKPGDNGGPTRTIPLSSTGSAVGGGIRSGTIAWDTLSDAPYKPVYFSDSKWYVLDTQQPVAAGVKVLEAETDQRGIKRKDPPSIGAYEFDATAVSVKPNPDGRLDLSIRLIALGRNVLLIHAPAPETYSIDLFNSKGEAMARLNLRLEAPSRKLDLGHDFIPGVYLMTIRNAKSKVSSKVVLE